MLAKIGVSSSRIQSARAWVKIVRSLLFSFELSKNLQREWFA
ncbi:hypothetical protein ABU16_0962 [Bacillus subtilis]|nr:hypothetical protein ABU16_0962 [Bacillus subtilis]